MNPANPSPLFAALLLLLVLAGLDQTLLGTMLPALSTALGRTELAPWVFTSYLTTSTIAVPVYGRLADRYGPWPMLLTTAGLFTLGSVACALAPTMPLLIAARALQGLGGGGLMTLAVVTAAWLYPPAERGRRMGMIGAAYSLATLVGPLAGGALLTVLPWQAAFWLNVPFAALAWFVIRRQRFGRGEATPARFDLAGTTLLAGGLAAVLWATRNPVGSAEGSLAVGAAAVLLAGWAWTARRAADPVVPLALFRDAAFRASAGVAALSGVVLFGSVVYLPIYLQNGLKFDALHSACCTVPLMVGISVAVQVVGRALRGGRSPAALGMSAGALMAVGAASVAVLLRLAPESTIGLGASLLPIGLGLGICFPLTTSVAQRRAPPTQLGAASALPVMLRSLGGALAVALLGEALRRHVAAAGIASAAQATGVLADGISTVFGWLAAAAVLAVALSGRLRLHALGQAPSGAQGQDPTRFGDHTGARS